jgi:flagellar motor protein MotB
VTPMGVPGPNERTNAATSRQQRSFAPVSFSAASPPPSAYQQWAQGPPNGLPPSIPISAAGQPPGRRSLLPKLIGIALVLILLVGAAVVGGVVYVGNKVRQKARVMAQSIPQFANDRRASPAKDRSPDVNEALQGLLNALSASGAASADVRPVLSSHDPVTPCQPSSLPTQDKARVPFAPGTVFTIAWGVKYGDVEGRNLIDSIDEATVTTTTDYPPYKDDNGKMEKRQTLTNQNCNSDYQAASGYLTANSKKMPRLMHDVTRYRLSAKAFREIKSSEQTNLQYVDLEDVANGVRLTQEGGVLTRVEPQDVQYPMIVNDQRVDLQAIHLTGSMAVVDNGSQPATRSVGEIFILDDPADPLVLNFRLKNPLYHNGNFRVEVVKIIFPVAKPENVLEKQLIQEKRAVTYGIYFDFNDETLKPESEPVLKEITQAMTDNPDWKLTVEGHTDNLGGDTYNLDLSNVARHL